MTLNLIFKQEAAGCQFHQCFMRAFFVQKFVQSQTLNREKTFVQKLHVDEIDNRLQIVSRM